MEMLVTFFQFMHNKLFKESLCLITVLFFSEITIMGKYCCSFSLNTHFPSISTVGGLLFCFLLYYTLPGDNLTSGLVRRLILTHENWDKYTQSPILSLLKIVFLFFFFFYNARRIKESGKEQEIDPTNNVAQSQVSVLMA